MNKFSKKDDMINFKFKRIQEFTVLFFLLIIFNFSAKAQDSNALNEKKWYITLPLRFTSLQNNYTMLSGVKIGRQINSELSLSFSVYHSFYLKSFKAEAPISYFPNKPRLFFNAMGFEGDYKIYSNNKINFGAQFYTAWGFMKYDLKEYNFKSKASHFVILEPGFYLEYNLKKSNYLGIGFSYLYIPNAGPIEFDSFYGKGGILIWNNPKNSLNFNLFYKGIF